MNSLAYDTSAYFTAHALGDNQGSGAGNQVSPPVAAGTAAVLPAAGAAAEGGLAAEILAGLARGLGIFFSALSLRGDTPQTTENNCSVCLLEDGTEVPVGTLSFRLDFVPPSTPHYLLPGDHVHLFRANQNPNNCQCFWQPVDIINPPPPPDAIPIQPFLPPGG